MIVELPRTPLFLTEHEIAMFLLFQKHYKLFTTLEEIGAFDVHGGYVTIQFNNDGVVRGIEKKQFYATN